VALGSESLGGQNVQTFTDAGRIGPAMPEAVESGASETDGLLGTSVCCI
jgi:hypothetical protein